MTYRAGRLPVNLKGVEMGQAKLRGTFEERKAQAIEAGRSHKQVKAQRESVKLAKYKQRQLIAETVARIIYGQSR